MGIIERKEREKEHRKEEILDAAQKVFFEKGLSASTMDEIAEAAELSKGTLYLYYKSKEDLYLGVLMRGMEVLHDMFEQAVSVNESAPRLLFRMGDAYTEFFNRHRSYFRMTSFFQTPHFHKQVSDEMKHACSSANHRLWELVINVMTRGIQEGMIREGLNPAEIGIIIWSSASALMQRIDTENDVWKERMHIDLEQTLRTSNMLFMDAILTDRGRAEIADIRTHYSPVVA